MIVIDVHLLSDKQIILEYQWLTSQKDLDNFEKEYKVAIDREIERRSISTANLEQ